MRRPARRSFTVEVKSNGRRTRAIIPHRDPAPAAAAPRPMADPEPSAPIVEKRRILPSLIEPEVPAVEPEPMPAVDELPPRRPRGRPRKVRPAPSEPVVRIDEEPAPAPAMQAMADQAPRLPTAPRPARARPTLDLARGERWKRRLGRWSR